MITAEQALTRLREGNNRFVRHALGIADIVDHTAFADMVREQEPFAVILGCSDSRVPAQMVFDAALGDLFVIRVAGNIASESQVGSIEYATAHLGTPLVVVLGHSHCGAVTATLDALEGASDAESKNLAAIIEYIRPSVEPLVGAAAGNAGSAAGSGPEGREALIAQAVRENVRYTVSELTRQSDILGRLVRSGKVRIVGAEYWLETGKVEFFEG